MTSIPLITILGPTAAGKTALAARVAHALNGEVISADSRQVYRGMDIGTGKDYDDYLVDGTRIPCHLIDIREPGAEYNIFEFQKDFHRVYHDILGRKKTPILCGGSGMYLETILKGYRLPDASTEEEFIQNLDQKTDDQLIALLQSYRSLHNKTDIEDRQRLIKALLVARQSKSESEQEQTEQFPVIPSITFGIAFPRDITIKRIAERLEKRVDDGMIAEVEKLLSDGISPETLIKYGLEYKFITFYLTGKISKAEMIGSLNIAIRQFAKRQMTWFRRMERQGIQIHWIDGLLQENEKLRIVLTAAESS
jgi:tRNA dimethylallyltransferase